jgi:hypothetical protein
MFVLFFELLDFCFKKFPALGSSHYGIFCPGSRGDFLIYVDRPMQRLYINLSLYTQNCEQVSAGKYLAGSRVDLYKDEVVMATLLGRLESQPHHLHAAHRC